MQAKTTGKCTQCGKAFHAAEAGTHLLSCRFPIENPSQSQTKDFLLRVSSNLEPGVYWMFVTISKEAPLSILDEFLRKIWLECCHHLSKFTIGSHYYMSYSEYEDESQSMDTSIGKVLSIGSKCDYIYDMGSPTDLEIKVIAEIPSMQKKVTVLLQNDPLSSCRNLCLYWKIVSGKRKMPSKLRYYLDFGGGTFAPLFLASDRPIAIACFLLVTVLPLLPLFKVPAFCFLTADLTDS